MISPLLVALACGAAASAAAVPAAIAVARRSGVCDAPGPRKMHAHAVPLLGGAAVLAGTVAGVAASGVAVRPLLFLAIGAFGVFLTGLADDLAKGRLSPWVRLALEAVAATVVVGPGGCRAGLVPGLPALDAAGTAAFLVLSANALNLSDNMNGLAGGIAAAAAGALAFATRDSGGAGPAVLAAIAGSAAAFLPFNWPRARLFLGDAGALFLGFAVPAAALSAGGSGVGGAAPHAAAVAVALGLPLADTAFVAISRLRRGVPVFAGDRRHVSHRLAAQGLGPARAAAALVAFSAGLAGASVAVAGGSRAALAAALVAIASLLAWAARSRRGLDDESPERGSRG